MKPKEQMQILYAFHILNYIKNNINVIYLMSQKYLKQMK